MTKKIALLMVVMLLASALVFVACSQNAGGGGGTKPPAQKLEVKDKKGTVSENLVRNGNFDDAESEYTDVEHASSDQGVDASIVADVGIGGSKALKVESIKNWGEIDIDMTRVYGRGKSYYIEASFKDDGTPADKKDSAIPHFSFTVVSNYILEKYGKEYYDVTKWDEGDDIYEGNEPMDDDIAAVTFGIETNQDAVPLADASLSSTDGWQTLSAIIPATVIDKFIGDSTLYKFTLSFYVGQYSDEPTGGQYGYKYLVDNVVVKDLNTEIDATGAYIDDSEYVPKEEEKPVEDDDE